MSAINFVDYFYRKINGVKRVSFDANLERQSGEGTYLFANGLPIGMATVGDCQGVKMEFDYGVAPSAASIAGDGKMAHGLNIKMTMDQDWDFGTKPYNGTVRCATLQAVSENDMSGRLEGAYINAQAQGTATIEGYSSGATPAGPGIIGIEARTELATSAQITTTGATGVLIFCRIKQDADLIASQGLGFYRGLQVEVPMLGTGASIAGTTSAIHVGNDWGGTDTFDVGLYIASGTCTTGINIEGTVTLALGIGSTTALTTATTATNAVKVQSNFSGNGYHIANYFSTQYTLDGASYGTVRAVVGVADLEATQTSVGTAQYIVGIHGRGKVSGTAYNSSLFVTGVHGQILDGGTYTAANHISAIWADWQLNKDSSAATSSELLYMTNNSGTVEYAPENAIFLYGPYVDNFVYFHGCDNGGMVADSAASAESRTGRIRISVNGDTRYLYYYD